MTMKPGVPEDVLLGIGKVATASAMFETQIPPLAVLVVLGPDQANPRALAIHCVFKRRSVHERMEILADLVELRAPAELVAKFRVAHTEFKRLNEERNRLVHTFWGFHYDDGSGIAAMGFKESKGRGYQGHRGHFAKASEIQAVCAGYTELLGSLREIVGLMPVVDDQQCS